MANSQAIHERDRLFLASIVEHIPVMIFVKEAKELRFELWNPAGERLVGFSQESLLGKNDHDFFPKEQADFFTATDRKVLEGKVPADVAEEPLDTPGGKRWLHTRKVPILGPDGEPRYLLGISLDITERKLAQDELVRRNSELQEKEASLQQALGQILAIEGLAVEAANALEVGQEILGALDGGDSARARTLTLDLVARLRRVTERDGAR